jgi:hydrogenase nickel incorporation protein HypB
MNTRVVEIEESLMSKNDAIASELRARFAKSGTLVVNLLSSPGSGKTTLLEESLPRLSKKYRVGVLVGDQATENDAERLRRTGAPVHQITTDAECRLDAGMITSALSAWPQEPFDLLFIENVGNLICPAEYDLGEDLRAVLLSVTEGEDKPLKYPLAFNTSHVVLVTKVDIADAVGYDRAAALESVQRVNPGVQMLELSARRGSGMDAWIDLLEQRVREKQVALAT